MLFGLYAAAAGMLARTRSQETIAQNLANLASIGYKRQVSITRSFDDTLTASLTSRSRRGGTPRMALLRNEVMTDSTQGMLRANGSHTDLAIEGQGFFVVGTPDGQRLTRAGAFHVNARGELATADGLPVLSERDRPIYPAADTWEVGPDGVIRVGPHRIAKLKIALPEGGLRRDGHGLLHAVALRPAPPEGFQIRQGFLEMSNAEPIREMVAMITGARAYEMAQRAITAQDQSLERLISEVGST